MVQSSETWILRSEVMRKLNGVNSHTYSTYDECNHRGYSAVESLLAKMKYLRSDKVYSRSKTTVTVAHLVTGIRKNDKTDSFRYIISGIFCDF